MKKLIETAKRLMDQDVVFLFSIGIEFMSVYITFILLVFFVLRLVLSLYVPLFFN